MSISLANQNRRNQYRIDMKLLRDKLPVDYPSLILKHRFPEVTDLKEIKLIKRILTKIASGDVYKKYIDYPDYVELLEELADKYEFFLKIYGSN